MRELYHQQYYTSGATGPLARDCKDGAPKVVERWAYRGPQRVLMLDVRQRAQMRSLHKQQRLVGSARDCRHTATFLGQNRLAFQVQSNATGLKPAYPAAKKCSWYTLVLPSSNTQPFGKLPKSKAQTKEVLHVWGPCFLNLLGLLETTQACIFPESHHP